MAGPRGGRACSGCYGLPLIADTRGRRRRGRRSPRRPSSAVRCAQGDRRRPACTRATPAACGSAVEGAEAVRDAAARNRGRGGACRPPARGPARPADGPDRGRADRRRRPRPQLWAGARVRRRRHDRRADQGRRRADHAAQRPRRDARCSARCGPSRCSTATAVRRACDVRGDRGRAAAGQRDGRGPPARSPSSTSTR